MLDRDYILSKIRETRSLISGFGVEKIGLFGSFATDSEHSGNDIDILVRFKPDHITFHNYMDLKLFLEDLFQTDVDLVIEDDIREVLRDEILGSVIYAA